MGSNLILKVELHLGINTFHILAKCKKKRNWRWKRSPWFGVVVVCTLLAEQSTTEDWIQFEHFNCEKGVLSSENHSLSAGYSQRHRPRSSRSLLLCKCSQGVTGFAGCQWGRSLLYIFAQSSLLLCMSQPCPHRLTWSLYRSFVYVPPPFLRSTYY